MSKLNFLQGATKDEFETAENLLQQINLSSSRNTITNFLTEYEQVVLKKIIDYNYSNVSLQFFGGYPDSERKRAKIIVNDNYDIDYNIICLKATYNTKFNNIKHKDVLGAVHNLGINFNRIGDIALEEGTIYIFVDEAIVDYVVGNFTKIARANLTFEQIELSELTIEKNYDYFDIVSSSFRLDSLVAKITNKSRSKVKEMLEKEYVKLNQVVITAGEKTCKQGDKLSIRKYGRYIVDSSSQNKKTTKYRIKIGKLV